MGKLSKDRRDIYYRKAKENGYRARSSYKLIQINEKFNILQLFYPELTNLLKSENYKHEYQINELIEKYNCSYCYKVVDLCSAPGSWSQVLKNICLFNYYQILYAYNLYELQEKEHEKISNTHSISHEEFVRNFSLYVNYNNELEQKISSMKKNERIQIPKIVSVDLQEIGSMNYVDIIQGDITKISTIEQIKACMMRGIANTKEKGDSCYDTVRADIVVNDGAPDITGMNDIDEFIQSQLILSSLKVCCALLKLGGYFISKIFRGEHTGLLVMHLNNYFDKVYICKPQSSRNKSLESFLVCLRFTLPKAPIISLHDVAQEVSSATEEREKENDGHSELSLRSKHVELIEGRDSLHMNESEKHAVHNNIPCENVKNHEQDIDSSLSDHSKEENLLKNEQNIFNFYYSDSDNEVKYFNSDDEEMINDCIASLNFEKNKLFTFVATEKHFDSDQSYMLPNNYKRYEPQLMPLKPPYMLSLQKKRQQGNKKLHEN